MGLTLEQLQKMGAKPVTGPLNESQMKAAGGTPLKSSFGEATTALGSSQAAIDYSKVFTSPLHNIAAGNGQDNLDHAKGALIGLAQGVAPAGAQNAGPIGADMLAHSPAMAQATQGLSTWKPANTAQAVGQGEGNLASLMIPGEAGVIGGETAVKKASPFLGTAVSKLGEGVQNVGKSIYKFFLPQSEKESALLRTYKANNPLPQRIATAISGGESKAPKTMADSLFDSTKTTLGTTGAKGTEGQLGIAATRGKDAIWKEVIAPKLAEADKTHKVSMNSFFDELGADIVKNNPEPARQAALIDGLTALKEDYKGTDLVKPSELEKFKQAWAEHLPNKAFRGQEIGPAYNEVKNLAAKQARTGLYDLLGPDAKEAYIDHGNLQAFAKLADAETSGKAGKSVFSWDSIKNKALVPVGTVAGKTIYRVGQLAEVVGEAGARTLGDLEIFKALNTQQIQDSPQSDTQASSAGNPIGDAMATAGNYLKDGLNPANSKLLHGTSDEKMALTKQAVDNSVGMGVGSVENQVAKVAQKVGGADIKMIQNFINDPSAHNYMSLQPILDAEKHLTSMSLKDLQDFFKEVVIERNNPNFKP